ncbi:MAG TPA: hypothetical protein VMR33_13885 [Candidatus Baltobacteraceae bacterium]|jgi:hypothetical protein|nr:hypothetical protein [Candidatus Baltobacteraceae bacterium]
MEATSAINHRHCDDDSLGRPIFTTRPDGPARRAHDEKAAQEMLQRGLRLLGIKEFKQRPTRAGEKVALAWWLRQRTTVSLRWAAQRL